MLRQESDSEAPTERAGREVTVGTVGARDPRGSREGQDCGGLQAKPGCAGRQRTSHLLSLPPPSLLQGVHESRGATKDYLRLETLIPKVVSPYLGTYGLYSSEGPFTHSCILGRGPLGLGWGVR